MVGGCAGVANRPSSSISPAENVTCSSTSSSFAQLNQLTCRHKTVVQATNQRNPTHGVCSVLRVKENGDRRIMQHVSRPWASVTPLLPRKIFPLLLVG